LALPDPPFKGPIIAGEMFTREWLEWFRLVKRDKVNRVERVISPH